MESDFEMGVRQFLAGAPFLLRNVPKDALRLFCTALTHDSFSNEALQMDPPRVVDSYERLEFLGDAVLEMLVCEHIFVDTTVSEGPMTDYKQDKVSNSMLSQRIRAKGVDIDGILRTSTGLPDGITDNMRADAFEALVAAMYLSYGLDEARRVALAVVLD